MPFKQVASSGMKARLLIYSQPHSTLCNKTLIETMGCNADAAAAMCKVLGQQLDTLIQNRLSKNNPPSLIGCSSFNIQANLCITNVV